MSLEVGRRAVTIQSAKPVKGADDRTYELVFATEEPTRVDGYPMPEVLRMRGCKLRRLRANPVLLDSHGEDGGVPGIRAIIGTGLKGEPRIEGDRLVAKVRLDETPEGEAAKQRLDSGSLRTASLGYTFSWQKTRELRAGETDGRGESLVEGPAMIRNEWEPFELTLCAVPADERAVRLRSFQNRPRPGAGRKESPVSHRSKMRYQDLPADADEHELDDAGDEAPAPRKVKRSAPKERAPEDEDARPARPARPPLAEEREADRAEALARAVRSFTPKGLEAVAEKALLEGKDVEECRQVILRAHAKRNKPLGTPEPAPDAGDEDEGDDQEGEEVSAPEAGKRSAPVKAKGKAPKVEINEDTVLRALTGQS